MEYCDGCSHNIVIKRRGYGDCIFKVMNNGTCPCTNCIVKAMCINACLDLVSWCDEIRLEWKRKNVYYNRNRYVEL